MAPGIDLAHLSALPPHKRAAVVARARWLAQARSKQIPAGLGWYVWLALAGRGFGKTKAGAEDAWWNAAWQDGLRYAVVAATTGDLRRTIFEGDSGILSCVPPECLRGGTVKEAYNRSLFELHFANGSLIQGYSADAPDRLRGPQFHRAWADELAAWPGSEAWDMLMMTLRLGADPRVMITTTPKPTKLIKDLVKRGGQDVCLVRGSTFENAANLAPQFLAQLRAKYEGTRLGAQELYAEVLDDVPGALWSRDNLSDNRLRECPDSLARVVVAIDPAATSAEGADETGLIVAARGRDHRGYVLADYTLRGSPDEWGRRAVRAYDDYHADRIVAEVNNGGDMVHLVVKSAAEALWREGKRRTKEVAFRAVHASRGKVTRAEPISALYEQNRVSHVGHFVELEEQQVSFTSDFDRKTAGYSPDRVDALVWALTEVMLGEGAPPLIVPDELTRVSPWTV